MKNRPNTFSLFCICFFLPGMLLAQQFGLRNYTAADGLAQSQVFAMIEDSRGYIWLGTRGGGLSRFDGKDFVNYTSREGLINNYLWTLHEDRQGDIWVGTNGGVCRFDGQVFHRYNLHDSVLCIAEDETGKIWLGTNSGLFCQQQDSAGKLSFESFRQLEGLTSQAVHAIHIDPSGWQWLGLESKVWAWKGDSVLRFGSREGIPYGKKIRDFFADTQGKLWAATYGGGLLQRMGGRFRAQAPRGALYRGYLFDIESDRKGRLWMATQNSGVVIYDPQNDKLSSLQDSDGLPTNYVRSVLEDRWGNIWLGTSGGGLVKYFGQQFRHYDQSDGLPGQAVYSVIEDQDCHIWMGVGARGLAVLQGDSISYHNAENGFTDRKVRALLQDSQGRIWAGTDGEGLRIFQDGSIIPLKTLHGVGDNWIRDILEDEQGVIWVATTGNGITRINWPEGKAIVPREQISILNENQGLPQNHINCLHQDQQGRIWFGTASQGLGYLDQKQQVHEVLLPGNNTNNQVRTMAEDDYGYLWVGTAGGSLKRIQLYSDTDTFPTTVFSENLRSTNIYLLGLDAAQRLWIGTEKGVERVAFDPDRNPIDYTFFGRAEGFLGVETTQNAFFKDREERLWFGTMGGLSQFLPEQGQDNSLAPVLSLTNIRLTYEPLEETRFAGQIGPWHQPKSTLSFPYRENHLGFDFQGVNLKNPEGVQYQWRLEGLEENWSRPSPNPSATYANLEPGVYQFFVKACNADQSCSEIQSVQFEIKPPLWQILWFQLLLGALLLGMILLGFRMRLNQVKHKAQEERQRLEMEKDLIRLEQKALGLQMNPHFLFNALNSIQALIAVNDPKMARYYLAKFARLMRLVLENSRETLIPLQQEIQTLDIYLAIEQFSRDQSFSYSLEVAPDLDPEAILIPPLLVQPFVENAIIHGIAHQEEAGNISVTFGKVDELLECVITDNGIGRGSARKMRSQQSHVHKSTGLEVTQERLDILRYGENQAHRPSIEFVDHKNEDGSAAGTTAIVRLPMQEEWE